MWRRVNRWLTVRGRRLRRRQEASESRTPKRRLHKRHHHGRGNHRRRRYDFLFACKLMRRSIVGEPDDVETNVSQSSTECSSTITEIDRDVMMTHSPTLAASGAVQNQSCSRASMAEIRFSGSRRSILSSRSTNSCPCLSCYPCTPRNHQHSDHDSHWRRLERSTFARLTA